jgi:hypothetical protein
MYFIIGLSRGGEDFIEFHDFLVGVATESHPTYS